MGLGLGGRLRSRPKRWSADHDSDSCLRVRSRVRKAGNILLPETKEQPVSTRWNDILRNFARCVYMKATYVVKKSNGIHLLPIAVLLIRLDTPPMHQRKFLIKRSMSES
jgi:hypothetical protein